MALLAFEVTYLLKNQVFLYELKKLFEVIQVELTGKIVMLALQARIVAF